MAYKVLIMALNPIQRKINRLQTVKSYKYNIFLIEFLFQPGI